MTSSQSITVSLEKAQELKEAGWPQDACTTPGLEHLANAISGSYFIWENGEHRCDTSCNCGGTHGGWEVIQRKDSGYDPWLPAPTAEEILWRLPKALIEKQDDGWRVQNCDYEEAYAIHNESFFAPSLADAAADMFVYLSKNNLLPKTV